METPYAYFVVAGQTWPSLGSLIEAAERTAAKLKPHEWYRLGVKGMRWADGSPPGTADNLGELQITPGRVAFSDIEPCEHPEA